MNRRQQTAFRLAGNDPTDARLHEEVDVRGKRRALRAYTILAIVWIRDQPHWRAAVTLLKRDGHEAHPSRLSLVGQAAGHELACALLEGVGDGAAVSEVKSFSFIATKRLTSDERAELKARADRVHVGVAEVADLHVRMTLDELARAAEGGSDGGAA